MSYTPHWAVVWRARDALIQGALVTLELTILSMAIGTLLGVLLALGARSGRRVIVAACAIWVEVARNTPALFQIYFAYFGLGSLGVHLSSFVAVLGALSFNNAGYMAEIVRGGLNAIPPTQRAAALTLGLRPAQVYRYVILPQVARIVYFPATNQLMWAMLNTSLGMTVGLHELAGATSFQQSLTFRAFEFFLVTAIVYYLLAKALMLTTRVVGWRLLRD
jgi:polar amino acid transport system permease protein